MIDERPMPPVAWRNWAWPKVSLPAYQCNRETIAYHEAGHLVIAHIVGFAMTGGEVYATPNESGRVGHAAVDMVAVEKAAAIKPGYPLSERQRLACLLTAVFVGGRMAELRFHGLKVTGWLAVDDPDFKLARKLLCECFGWDRPLYYCQELVDWILREHWAWVDRVADRLFTQGQVNAEDVAALQ